MTNTTRTADEMAAYWVIRCSQDDPMSTCEVWAFVEWMCRSPENVVAFERMCWLDKMLELTLRPASRATRGKSNVVQLRPTTHRPSASDDVPKANEPPRGRKRFATGWNVAAIAATLVIALLVTLTITEGNAPISAIKTASMSSRVTTLADGAVVHYDQRSGFSSEVRGNQHIIYLRSGQAMFEVPLDQRTPFIVVTDLIEVAAEPGSRFTVEVNYGGLVALDTGRATVAPRGKTNSTVAVTLRPGMVARASIKAGQVVITSMESK